jgi:MBG domain (YGX type)/SprB repeat/Putative Ig domain
MNNKITFLFFIASIFWFKGNAQTQFWSDTFDTSPTSGTRTPEENGGVGGLVNTSYFRLTDGSTVSQAVSFTGKEGTNYWAGEDHNAVGTGFTASGAEAAPANSALNELSISWTGINISGKTGLSFKGLFAANSTNEPWDNMNACASGVGTTNTDYIIVQYRIDTGAYVDLIRFYNRGSATNGVDKYLFEDTDGNGCGDGTQLTNIFGEFVKTISGTGTTLDLKINIYSEGSNEEWGIDNFRLFETPTAIVPTVATTAATGVGAVKATLGGNITSDGGGTVTERGIVWATTVNPTTSNTKATNGSGTGSFSGTISSLPAGTLVHFRAYAINSAGTSYGSDLTFTTNAALSATTGNTNISCNGGSNGTASVTASGGVTPYTYSWSPSGGTGAIATGLVAGAYTCTITDSELTQITKNFTITQPSAISTASGSQTNVSCNGGSNGTASVSPSGGIPGYTYSWSPSGGTAATASGLAAGSYTVTVTDANGCIATRNYTITQPSAISTASGSQTNVSCNGGTNGSASVSPSGGTPGYTYSWSPSGGTAATATGLAAGSYTVTVTDANGCTATRNYTITQPSAISTASGSQTNVSCNSGSNGSASVSPSGGTPGYTYSWSPSGGTAATATGLVAGSYTVTVTDANGCTATRNYTITQPSAISTASGSQTNVSCNGGTNGSASVSPSGGTPGYTYSWSPSGGTAATATGLAAGSYTVTVTDANGCTATRNYTITQPSAISTASGSQTNVSCNGGSNGSASVSPSGGTFGYTYSWSPSGGTAATATGLAAGSYTVTVTDANGCTATRNYTITQPSAISTSGSQTNVSCNGGSNGSASVFPSGGTSGYTYSWSPSGGTAATASGLAAGSYTVTVTDANGCTATRNYTITQPSAISFTTTTLSGYDYNSLYSQIIVVTGGTGTKSYAITAGSLPSGFTLLPNGEIKGISTQVADSNFTVTVTDLNNCTAAYSFVLKLNQIPITVTATASQTKVYGQSDPVLTYTVTPSLLSGDSFTGALTRVTGENIGNYAINVGTLSAGSKYLMTFVSKDFAITAKPITVTATASQTKVYGTADPVFAYSVSPSLVGGDSFTGTLTRVTGENIGNYAITQGSLSAGSNYTISYVSKDFAITAKPITVTATASQTKVYGTADPVFAYSVSPSLIGGDSFTGTLTRVTGENIGNYAITQGSLSAGSNYTISYVSKDFAITAKPITVTATASQTKVYGTTDPVFAYSVSPSLVSGDSFTGALTRVAGVNVGTYAITQGSLSAGSNYTISYVSKDFTITAKPITVTATASQTKVYGTADPVFAYSVSPSLVIGDSFTGALTRVTGENVGTYAITQGSLSAGSNYSITYIGNNFIITKADQIITWGQTLGLGCDGETSVILTATSNSGLPVSYTSSNSNIAAISNGLLVFKNYGSTTITASQGGNNNYNTAPVVVLPVVNSQPNLIRKQFEDIIFFDNSSKSFKSFSWYKNGVLVPGQTAQYFKESGALNGTYYAVATKLDGTLINSCPLILSPTVEEEYIRIVPNPVKTNSSYELVTNVSSSRLQNAHIEVYSLAGLLMESKTISENKVTMKASMVEGIYIVKMTLANGKYFTKNLLVRN